MKSRALKVGLSHRDSAFSTSSMLFLKIWSHFHELPLLYVNCLALDPQPLSVLQESVKARAGGCCDRRWSVHSRLSFCLLLRNKGVHWARNCRKPAAEWSCSKWKPSAWFGTRRPSFPWGRGRACVWCGRAGSTARTGWWWWWWF